MLLRQKGKLLLESIPRFLHFPLDLFFRCPVTKEALEPPLAVPIDDCNTAGG